MDIGANVGVFSQHAAEIVGSRGFVLSVEALPPTYILLQENRVTLQRQAASPCTWITDNAAVGDADGGTRSMTFFPRAAGWGTGMPKQHAALMQQDLKQFVRNLLEDNTSLVSHFIPSRNQWGELPFTHLPKRTPLPQVGICKQKHCTAGCSKPARQDWLSAAEAATVAV